MMKRKPFAVTMLLVLLLMGPLAVSAQEEGSQPSEEEIAAWMEAISPGEQHKLLEVLVGTWDTEVKMWETPDQAEPGVTIGTAEMKWILDGRYLQQKFSGTFMEMPFKGLGYTAYDKAAGHYVSVWMDSFSTGMMIETGSVDDTGKVFTSTGSYVDPITGVKTETRSVHRIESPDRHVAEMFTTGPKGEFKMMEIVYTRK
jgi:hypothetical protein